MEINLAQLHEAIASGIPNRDCIVFRDRRLSWADITTRTRQLANHLLARGLGLHVPRSQLQGWESGQDHIALYLYNGNEYLESMLGAFKARVVPVNVNYRYVGEELEYVLRDSGARGIVYHARFAPLLAEVRERLPRLDVLLQVPDESNHPLLPGALDYESALRAASAARPELEWSPDDLYMVYTGGTTGRPKGVLWRQNDIYFAGMSGRARDGSSPETSEGLRDLAAKKPARCALPAPPFMHGTGHWGAFIAFHAGMGVVIQSDPGRFDAHDVLSTIERERASALTLVGDAFARPLLDRMRQQHYDLSSLRIVTSSGALLTEAVKRELIARLPAVTLIDALGSSESGPQAMQISTPRERKQPASFEAGLATSVLDEDLRHVVAPSERKIGWLATRGHVPLGYLGDRAKTERTFPVIEGVRYSVPGDRARWGEDGRIELLGRDSATINSGGEKIFAEEVEQALCQHPAVYDALVCGRPSERWGQEVCAVVHLRPGATVQEAELLETCSKQLARYKLPKVFFFRDQIARSASGKPDYAWARSIVDTR